MSAEDAYTSFNDELDEIINATPERAAAVAALRAEMDDAKTASRRPATFHPPGLLVRAYEVHDDVRHD
jgi:hypothetical protein